MKGTVVFTALVSAAIASGLTLAAAQTQFVQKWGTPGKAAADINPASLSRFSPIERDALDAEGKRVYDLIAPAYAGRRFSGPAALSMHSPGVAESMHLMNEYLRKQGVLGPRTTELAILVTARELDQQFEWTAHELAGQRVGLEQSTIDLVKNKQDPKGLPEKDVVVIRFAQQLLREHKLSSQLCADAVRLFGERGTVDLAVLVGDYVLAGFLLETGDHQLPAEMKPMLPVLAAK